MFPTDFDPGRKPIRRGGLEAAYRRQIQGQLLESVAVAASEAVAMATEGTHVPTLKTTPPYDRTKHGCIRKVVRLPGRNERFVLTIDITLFSEKS